MRGVCVARFDTSTGRCIKTLGQFQFLSINTCRALAYNGGRQRFEGQGHFAFGIMYDNRLAHVATFAQFCVEGNLPEQRDSKFLRQSCAASGAEDLVALVVVSSEPTHVLDDAAHAELQFPRGVIENMSWFTGDDD